MTTAGERRAALGFAAAVRAAFGFLEAMGFAVVDEQATFVRYEADDRFVNVFHGRSSYELGVEIGRRVRRHGISVEARYPLSYVMALDHPDEAGFRTFATSRPDRLPAFVGQLATLTRQFGHDALCGRPDVFGRLAALAKRRSDALQQSWRAADLRRAADAAWRARDWGRVVEAYAEMAAELDTVEMKASEHGRLRYARARLDR
jgi:hypothetical protein